MVQAPGAVFTTLFFFVTYEWAKQARVFVPGRPFQPRQMFASKGGDYPGEAL
jgi:hypothetical protein